MEYKRLSESVKIKTVSENKTEGVFEIEGLYTGYGLTIGNALRRVLLSSIPGAAITQVKISGVKHEFSTIEGIAEDILEISLNLKKIRFKFFADEPQVLTLDVKGEKEVTAGDIKANSQVEVINSDSHIATLTSKKAELKMEITVEKGLGYVPAENRKAEKLPIGVIAIDAIFTPVIKVNFTIENMRVGEKTDYNNLKFTVETDGSIAPGVAMHKSANILKDHFEKISSIGVSEETETSETEEVEEDGKKAKKKAKK
jgi:DNA-directed RNA polymerase subunit alpha